jgi:hypothetical protein
MPKRDSVLAKLGLNVRKRREARELTQEKLAERGLRNLGGSHQLGNTKLLQIIEGRVIEFWRTGRIAFTA